MKAIVIPKFGGPDVLQLGDVSAPEPSESEVLVRVQAASINPVDGKIRRGELKLLAGAQQQVEYQIIFSVLF